MLNPKPYSIYLRGTINPRNFSECLAALPDLEKQWLQVGEASFRILGLGFRILTLRKVENPK